LPGSLASTALAEVAQAAGVALKTVEAGLPAGFPKAIHASVKKALTSRLNNI